jgi:formylglycine-generating enzyme required for sulfatase activity
LLLCVAVQIDTDRQFPDRLWLLRIRQSASRRLNGYADGPRAAVARHLEQMHDTGMDTRFILSRLGRQIDYLPASVAMALGALATTCLVGPFIWGENVLSASMVAVLCLACTFALASRARPVARLEPVRQAPQKELTPPISPKVRPSDSAFDTFSFNQSVEQAENGLGLEMMEFRGGSFLMGSPENEPKRRDNEGPQHRVTVSSFALAKLPISQRLYRETMAENPSAPESDELPVNNVSFGDAVTFCNHLSKRLGLKPCYVLRGNQVTWDRNANGYRLPTEAEWEYAARAGTASRYFFGNDESELEKYAWFNSNSHQIQPLSKKNPNPWGMQDMYGNVWEWCWDRYGSYKPEAQRDPTGPSEGFLMIRVLRGGSFLSLPRFLRSAIRNWFNPSCHFRDVGFRCARGSRRRPEVRTIDS